MVARLRKGREAAGQESFFFPSLGQLARKAEVHDPFRPAIGMLCVVVVLMGIGLLVQASHAATTSDPIGFRTELKGQILFRLVGLLLLVSMAFIGPKGIRRLVPIFLGACFVCLALVLWSPLGVEINGSRRWLNLGFVTFQPSELARIAILLWIADRCVRLGPLVQDMRRGVVPMLLLALVFFGLILIETDLGAAMLLLLCAFCTMWVGARPVHMAGTLLLISLPVVLCAARFLPYIGERFRIWFGQTSNEQVQSALDAMASGGLFGKGVGQGVYRNLNVPYLESDFALAQVGEELGIFGVLLVVGLLVAFTWFALQLVVSIRDRHGALCAFGLLISTSLAAMLHVQVVAGLAPPKGMTLPFISDGGTSLLVSSLAVGLALGAARHSRRPEAREAAS